jgi:hypothetical protein
MRNRKTEDPRVRFVARRGGAERVRSRHHCVAFAVDLPAFARFHFLRYAVSTHPVEFQKGNTMVFKPNYGLQRADRNRAAQAKAAEKQRKREEKAAQRRADRAAENARPTDGDKTSQG